MNAEQTNKEFRIMKVEMLSFKRLLRQTETRVVSGNFGKRKIS
jgi:hypothetical protein